MRLSTWIFLTLLICAAVWLAPGSSELEQPADLLYGSFYRLMKLTGNW